MIPVPVTSNAGDIIDNRDINAAVANATRFGIIVTTFYTAWSPGPGRSFMASDMFDTMDRALEFIMLCGEPMVDYTESDTFVTYTVIEYAPIPF